MAKKKDLQQSSDLEESSLFDKTKLLEKRINDLKIIFDKEKHQFIDEDLKARGLK
ncbi:MAG: hypothetical protein JXB48_18460 [Candidatus Latescibacteria bacterium]|nr:hypothetical protein [Candidatus Latescibacterota bacterium]